MLEKLKPHTYLIRLVGLLDQVPDKKFMQYCKRFEAGGYTRDFGPAEEKEKQSLQDYLYPDFRKVMFGDAKDEHHVRFSNSDRRRFNLVISKGDDLSTHSVFVVRCELYLFRGHIGLFSLKIELEPDQTIGVISDILNKIRNFNAKDSDNNEWHNWISKNYLTGIVLRSTEKNPVEADEFSGSKFKLFTAYDLEFNEEDRPGLLYDMGTVSPINSGKGLTGLSPDPEYFNQLLQNRVAAFKNWEALCLFDGFCAIGHKFLLDRDGLLKKDWDETYFRIYLFRLFFKYNLYRYSTLVSKEDSDKAVEYRDQFEDFLNHYNISHISFNFLPNMIFEKVGNALQLQSEVDMFRERIRNLSTAIQEQKQAKTNMLLQAVTALSGLGFLVDINSYLHQIQKFTHLSMLGIYLLLGSILLVVGFGIYYYLEPKKVKKWFAHK